MLGAFTLQWSHPAPSGGAGSQLTGGHTRKTHNTHKVSGSEVQSRSPGSWDIRPASESRGLTGEDVYGSELLSTGLSDLPE